jgi:uncharacterized YigZ family protein
VINDFYKTVVAKSTAELKEKGSRFIAFASPATDSIEAEAIVTLLAKKYHDATHKCFAYFVGVGPDAHSRYNDDGEPSGTAGKPILQAIIGLELTNVVVIVTRYFGGTKLGTGGLLRAYGGVASQALAAASIETRFLYDIVQLECSYHDLNVILNTVQKLEAIVKSSNYGGTVELQVKVRLSRSKQFIEIVIDHTAGRVTPLIIEQPK